MFLDPIISIITPLYNKENEVSRSVESVLAQTIRSFEFIIVDDGSTDNGLEVLQGFSDPRIRIVSQQNQGVSAARNRGIAEARTDLVAFIDADDEWMPDFLEIILHLREKFPSCEVFATNYVFYESAERFSPSIIRGIPRPPWEGILTDYFGIAAKSDPPLWTSAVAIKKGAIVSVGKFPVGIASGEDLLTWARLASKCDIAFTTKVCAKFKTSLNKSVEARVPQVPDVVGNGLLEILRNSKRDEFKSIKMYLFMWHRMRAACFLQAGVRSEARKEVAKMVRFSKQKIVWVIYAIAAYMPSRLSALVMTFLRYTRIIRRRLIAWSVSNCNNLV